MCKCYTLAEHQARTRYVEPSAGDLVWRLDDEARVGLLYHVDAYAGGLPRAHVVYDDGSEQRESLYLFQSPAHAVLDPCWWS